MDMAGMDMTGDKQAPADQPAGQPEQNARQLLPPCRRPLDDIPQDPPPPAAFGGRPHAADAFYPAATMAVARRD